MIINYTKRDIYNQSKIGRGFANNLINRLPDELHLPDYQFCGPGTKLATRLARGEKGINPLDAACREHDIAYSQSEDINKRHQADNILTEEAWQRVKSKDSDLKERINAWFITNGMKAKVKFGLGMSASKTSRKRKTKKVRKVKKTKIQNTHRHMKIISSTSVKEKPLSSRTPALTHYEEYAKTNRQERQ
uniref:Phospholipase A2-like domain-containing protein n=1 Tax=Glossina morsitans morsitans TaxID=37546 RepID=A0A1B0G6Y9_GLOMM